VAGKASSDALGRVVADQRLEALNHASLEQQSAMLANASAMERFNAYQRLSPGMQRQVLDRAPETQRISFDRFVAERIQAEKAASDALGRVVADQRLEALNHASLEQQSAMLANASAMERFNAYQRLSPGMQRQVLDRAPEAQRIGFDRFVAERIVAGKASSDALGRVVADQRLEALNHASLEQQSAMLANASAMERLNAYQRLSPGMQRQVLDRAPEAQRIDFERFVAERISQQRVSQDRVTQERVSTQRIDQP